MQEQNRRQEQSQKPEPNQLLEPNQHPEQNQMREQNQSTIKYKPPNALLAGILWCFPKKLGSKASDATNAEASSK
jgi:hypothetical protein